MRISVLDLQGTGAVANHFLRSFSLIVVVALAASSAARAGAVETFDGYPLHVNCLPFFPPGYPPNAGPGEYVFRLYGDAPQNSELVGSWSWDSAMYGGRAGANDCAGIAADGVDVYALTARGRSLRYEEPGCAN